MEELEYKSWRGFEIKGLQDDGSFSGHAAVFGNVDLDFDRIEKGAFKDSLSGKSKFTKTKSSRVILLHHDWQRPIGMAELKEDKIGLVVERGKLNLERDDGRDAYAGMKGGEMRAMSVGMVVTGHSWEDEVRVISKADIFEVSVVPTGLAANPKASISAVKSLMKTIADDPMAVVKKAIDKAKESDDEDVRAMATEIGRILERKTPDVVRNFGSQWRNGDWFDSEESGSGAIEKTAQSAIEELRSL